MARGVDLYEVLGVARDASPDDIRRAYRGLARELHPDASGDPSTEERFKEVTAAYEILSDPEKRQRYDRFGDAAGPGAASFTDISDLFDAFFGGFGVGQRPRRRSRVERGEDLFVRLDLDFREAVAGATREIAVDRLAACDACDGVGAREGTAPTRCRTCGGTGAVQDVRRGIFGSIMTTMPCTRCEGTGEEIVDRCGTCAGRGRVAAAARIPVEIPAGVADGLEIRLTGHGHAGRAGGAPGDLYLAIAVAADPVFERRGQDLFATLDVPLAIAALGGDVEIETLDGPRPLTVPEGADSGEVLRLRGLGVPNLGRRGRGDLFVTLHVATPRGITREQRDLLRRLAEVRDDPAPSLRRIR